ncbi:hypothetical protein M427DRAFT_53399 [Gonapodya prolifera JEL478]|uniref:Uncharacterized protein n=1 Tax=Gonapodya prolifera (strain JEL478) TaxID=1344416 RepID=A0A139AQ83_GONPJ|nr:hypothetical protein M427DRAFT_53399 [Gonapodya prolifera JEL478]|eukprot:KXS18917.1 hypothetical protein M427DRAFT_53399 [Gonapodya prolifera JEL478]
MVTSPSSPVVPSSPESPPFTTAPPFLQPKHTRRPPQRRSIVPKTRIYDPRDIEQPIQNVRETILRTIISEYEDFLAVYVPVSSIEEDLQEIKEKLATCSENDPHVKSLSYKLETLTSLFKAHSLITALSSLLDTADIRGAAVKAAELLDLMEDLPTREMVPDERPALELLKSARTRYVSKLRHTLRSLLISAIRIHKPSPTSVELSIRTRVLGTHARTYYEDPVDLMDAWVAAETVGGVTRQLGDVITKAVADELIVKIVEGGIKVTSGGGRMNMWIKVEPEKGPKAYGGAG